MEWLKELAANVPAAVAVIVTVKLFLVDRREDRKLWENHLSRSVAAQEKTAAVLEMLVHEVRELH